MNNFVFIYINNTKDDKILMILKIFNPNTGDSRRIRSRIIYSQRHTQTYTQTNTHTYTQHTNTHTHKVGDREVGDRRVCVCVFVCVCTCFNKIDR